MVRPIVCLLWLQVLPLPGLREIVRHQPEVVTSRAIGEQLLRWNAVEKPWHLGGELGIELELGYDNWLSPGRSTRCLLSSERKVQSRKYHI
eukprot:g21590.t1